jgi:hypothetical protein
MVYVISMIVTRGFGKLSESQIKQIKELHRCVKGLYLALHKVAFESLRQREAAMAEALRWLRLSKPPGISMLSGMYHLMIWLKPLLWFGNLFEWAKAAFLFILFILLFLSATHKG